MISFSAGSVKLRDGVGAQSYTGNGQREEVDAYVSWLMEKPDCYIGRP